MKELDMPVGTKGLFITVSGVESEAPIRVAVSAIQLILPGGAVAAGKPIAFTRLILIDGHADCAETPEEVEALITEADYQAYKRANDYRARLIAEQIAAKPAPLSPDDEREIIDAVRQGRYTDAVRQDRYIDPEQEGK